MVVAIEGSAGPNSGRALALGLTLTVAELVVFSPTLILNLAMGTGMLTE
jgi:hypothetical protein